MCVCGVVKCGGKCGVVEILQFFIVFCSVFYTRVIYSYFCYICYICIRYIRVYKSIL